MFQLKQIKVILCNFLRRVLRASAINCEFFSIWECTPSPPKPKPSYPRMAVQYVTNKFSCSEELFPFMFYFVLVISMFGFLHNCIEFLRVLREKNGVHLLRMWRPRRFVFFNEEQLRRFRILGHLLMILVWLMLLYAVVRVRSLLPRTSTHPAPLIHLPQVKPQLFTPWLTISSISMAIDGCFVVGEAIYQRRMITLRTFLLVVCPVLNMHCAACVKKKFVGAYAASGEPSLTWW
ncbi:hypothetical protein KR067_002414 [Drosophila pandora]|nr:hypothetical protein KR067_002414 [Drosophila pandora]